MTKADSPRVKFSSAVYSSSCASGPVKTFPAPRFHQGGILKMLGEEAMAFRSSRVKQAVERWKEDLKSVISPRVVYASLPLVSSKNGAVKSRGGPVFRSGNLARAFEECSELVFFVATLGHGIESEIKRLSRKNRVAEAYILDAMGSMGVEDVVDQFQSRAADYYLPLGYELTYRFSPGYCDWPITEQKKLFSVFKKGDTGVKLLGSCLMSPRKSVSGVFGVRPKGSVNYNPCLICPKSNCDTRRI